MGLLHYNRVSIGSYRGIIGLYRVFLGSYRGIIGLYKGYIGIMKKKMETTKENRLKGTIWYQRASEELAFLWSAA